jgi:ketosteroid isomerase-like protein
MIKFILYLITLLISFFAIGQINEIEPYTPSDVKLHNEIVKMDTTYFNAYNTCDMKTQADIYDEDLEFFHDKGGLSTSKSDLLKSLENNICGKVTRTLIKDSIEVYPIKGYGAVQIGYHKFFNKEEPNAKSIPSKFIVIWKNKNNSWKITKVISLHN